MSAAFSEDAGAAVRGACDWIAAVLSGADAPKSADLSERFAESFLAKVPAGRLSGVLDQVRFKSRRGAIGPVTVQGRHGEFEVVDRFVVTLQVADDQPEWRIASLVFKALPPPEGAASAAVEAAARWVIRALDAAPTEAEVHEWIDPRLLAQKPAAAFVEAFRTQKLPVDSQSRVDVQDARAAFMIGTEPLGLVGLVDVDPNPPHLIVGVVFKTIGADARPVAALERTKRRMAYVLPDSERDVADVADEVAAVSNAPAQVLAIGEGGSLAYLEARGEPWLGASHPPDENTLFRVGSITKVITAFAVLRQVRAQTLDLDAPISEYLSVDLGWDAAPPHPTIRHLLTHTGGLPRDVAVLGGDTPISVEHLVGRIGRLSPPGEQARYSNVGYGLLGFALEAVAGKPYAELAAIEAPGIAVDAGEPASPPAAKGYSVGAGMVFPAFVTPESFASAGGVTASARQLVALGTRLCREPGMHEDHSLPTSRRMAVDLDTSTGRRFMFHNGGRPGWWASMWADPDNETVAVVLLNTDAPGLAHTGRRILQTFGRSDRP